MKCIECGHTMTTQRESYRYAPTRGLQVVLRDVKVSRCQNCGDEEVAIPRVEELHRVIARTVLSKRQRLTASEVRYLRKYLGWSAADFAAHMGAARETVSRWESGERHMGPQADRLLRLLVAQRAPIEDYSTGVLADITDQPPPRRATPLEMAKGRSGWHESAAVA